MGVISKSPEPQAPQATPANGQLSLGNQAMRFIAVGVVSAIVDFGLLQFLMIVFGMDGSPAKAISFVFGTLTAYMLNRRYTFRAEHSWRNFLTVMALYALMFAVQWGLFNVVNNFLLSKEVHSVVASTVGFVIGQGVATVTNFIVQRTVIFRHRPDQPVEEPAAR